MKQVVLFTSFVLFMFTPGYATEVSFLTHNFTPEEKSQIEQAADATFRRLISSDVANCIYREAFRAKHKTKSASGKVTTHLYTKDQLRQMWSSQVAFLNKFKRFKLAVEKKQLDKNELGRAKLAVAVVDRANYDLLHLKVTLDPDKIKSSKLHATRQQGEAGTMDAWINVLAHEITHNLGYSHGVGHDWETDYPGYVPTEAGFCAMTNGQYGSHLGDFQLLQQRKARFKSEKG